MNIFSGYYFIECKKVVQLYKEKIFVELMMHQTFNYLAFAHAIFPTTAFLSRLRTCSVY